MVLPTLRIDRSPNGISYVEYGLKNFNFQTMYTYEPTLYQGCKPFTALCRLVLYILVCLTDTPSNNDKMENKHIAEFRNMEKSDAKLIKNFFTNLEKKTHGCSMTHSLVTSSSDPDRTEFFESKEATFKTKNSILYNKIMILGALYRENSGLQEFMLQCSVLKSPIKRNDLIECHETKEVKYNTTFTYIQFWTIWAKIKCLKFAKFDDCGPICIERKENSCNDIEGEKCLTQYVKVDGKVSYFNGNRLILSRIEKRCLFQDNCLKSTCSFSSTACISLESGKGECENVNLKVEFKNGSKVSDLEFFPVGSKLRCAYSFDAKFQAKLKSYKYVPVFYWSLIKTSIKYGLVVDKDILTLSDVKYTVSQKESLTVEVDCVFKMSSNVPNYKSTLLFTLFKPPSKLSTSATNNLVYTNQQLKCMADAFPKTDLLFEYKIITNNFKPDIGYLPYLHVPRDSVVGSLTLKCRAKLTLGTYTWLSDFATFNLTLIRISNMSWGSENKIIYAPTIISCTAIIHLIHDVLITQLNGPSELHLFNKTSFKIATTHQGGQYRVLCTYNIDRDRKMIYNRIYKFQIYRFPVKACISLILGYGHLYLICLHNGFPLDLGPTEIVVSKFLRGNSLQNIRYKNNKIKIMYEGKNYKYRLNCSTSYDNHKYNISIQFYLIQSSGLSLKSLDVRKHKCDNITINEYARIPNNNYWIEKPKLLSFHEYRIFISFVFLVILIVVIFFIIHVYSFDKFMAINMTTNSLSRRHCVMRLNNKMMELALFRVKNAGSLRIAPLRDKFEAYKRKSQETVEDNEEKETILLMKKSD